MGTIELILCIFVGQYIAAQPALIEQDALFHPDFPGFFDNVIPLPFKRNFPFTPFENLFSSRHPRIPNFHMLATLPPFMNFPRVEVSCDESTMTLLVDKRSNSFTLTGEEMQLGDGCLSNRELPNQFVFVYSLDKCGTMRVVENGLEMFTNALHLNLKKSAHNWWSTPSTVHLYCIPRRSYDTHNLVSTALPEYSRIFNFQAMNPSWTSVAESNEYRRGQVINLQVFAQTKPEQQLFLESCFVSASPEPQTRPRHMIIMNKGCTDPLGSPHAVIQFVASNRADVVNLVLNTSYLIYELYIHCNVLITDQGVTSGSKSCNYNVIQSRWDELSGVKEVCECCRSKCKGLPVKQLQEDAKAIVSTGPFIILDKDLKSPESISEPMADSMQSDSPDVTAAENDIVSGTPLSKSQFISHSQGVVVVRQEPEARLTFWLPGQVKDTDHNEHSHSKSEGNLAVELKVEELASNDLPELKHSTDDRIGDQGFNILTLVDGWILPLEKATIQEESQRKRFGRSGLFEAEDPQKVVMPVPAETENVHKHHDFKLMRDKAAVVSQEEINEAQPILRSKVEFSKSPDGTQKVSFEEEVVKRQEGSGVMRRFGMDQIKSKWEPKPDGFFSAFLDFLRRTD